MASWTTGLTEKSKDMKILKELQPQSKSKPYLAFNPTSKCVTVKMFLLEMSNRDEGCRGKLYKIGKTTNIAHCRMGWTLFELQAETGIEIEPSI